MSRNLHGRLSRLEAQAPPEGHVSLAFVDKAGVVLACGLPADSPWVGRHMDELPPPIKFFTGFCGEQVVGRERCEAHRRLLGDESQE
jgi:hypothetical protein